MGAGYSFNNKCVPDASYADYAAAGYTAVGCGDMPTAIIYMDSFILLVRLIFLNLFIAIILDSFGDVTDQEARLLNSDMVERILESWANFDSNATGFIKVTDFEAFMRELRRPIGWDEEDALTIEDRNKFIHELNLPIYNEMRDYQFTDVGLALCKRVIIHEEIDCRLKQNPFVN
jgi:hypothetical protein